MQRHQFLCNFGVGGSLLPYTLNFTGLSAFPGGWTAPNWTVSSNTAKNTPTLGSELIVNGGFGADANWVKGADWSIGSGVATKAAGATSNNISQNVMTVGTWYKTTWQITAISAGGFFTMFNAGSISYLTKTQIGSYANTGRCVNTLAGISPTAAAAAGSVDNVSYKALSNILAYRDFSAANVIVKGAWTIVAGYQAGVVARMSSNGANYLLAYYIQPASGAGTCVLIKKVGATTTQLVSASAAYAAGANVEIRTNGSTVQLFYNNAQVGTNQTVNDVETTNTIHGLFSTDVSNTCASFSVTAN